MHSKNTSLFISSLGQSALNYSVVAAFLLAGPILSGQPAGYREASVGGMQVFGLDPAWKGGREFEKVFDVNDRSYYDYAHSDSATFVGIDKGVAEVPVKITFAPRPKYEDRMIGGTVEGSNETPWSGYETIHTFTQAPPRGWQSISIQTGKAYRYYRFHAPAGSHGNISEFYISSEAPPVEPDPGPEPEPDPDSTEPEGFRTASSGGYVVFGLDPAWASGREFEMVFDGNNSSFYDYDHGERESFAGIDFGTAIVPATILYTPRAEYEDRMLGGRFEGSNDTAYSGYETIHEVDSIPASGGESVALNISTAYRYIRFLSPVGAHGNIAEFSVVEADTIDPGPEPNPDPDPNPGTEILYPEGYREVALADRIIFGLDPAWAAGGEFEKAFDGDTGTFYDFKYSDRDCFAGIDYGVPIVPGSIQFQARSNYSERMIGSKFQGSNESSVSGYVTLHEVTSDPGSNARQASLSTTDAYRYYRYLSPMAGHGNVAEFSIVEAAAVEPQPEPDPEILPGQEVNFSLTRSGPTSAAVYDSTGKQVRTLLTGEKLESGTHALVWDGLDRNGVAAPQGTYELRVLQAEGLKSRYVTSLGINPGSAPYDTWLGTSLGVTASAVDATGLYLVAQFSETAPTLLKQSLDGTQRIWTKHDTEIVSTGRFQGGIALASNGQGRVFMLQQNGYLQVIDGQTGQLLTSWDILPGETVHDDFLYTHSGGKRVSGADVSANARHLVLSFQDLNTVYWVDPAGGAVLATVAIPSPRGVAVGSGAEVYVISEGEILSLSPDGSARTVIDSSLNDPTRLAFDAQNNHLLVTDGTRGGQVKRFNLQGDLIQTYGRDGGRQFGTYVDTDFYGMTDITADAEGGFYIVEPSTPPRRVAHFNMQGNVINEWYGAQDYYAYATPDPRDPSRAWLFTGDGLVLLSIDYDTGEWSVLETWVPNQLANGLIKRYYGFKGHWNVVYSGSQRYLVSEVRPQVLRHNEGELKAVSISSSEPDQMAKVEEIMGAPKPSWARAFVWSDSNGDGLPQAAEIYYSGSSKNVPNVREVNDDFSLVGFTEVSDGLSINVTQAEWGPYGPYYPVSDFEATVLEQGKLEIGVRPDSRGSGSYQDNEGSLYGFYNTSIERHGVFWPTDWAGSSRLAKLDADGNELWSVGRHAYNGGLAGLHDTTYIPTPNGQFHVPVRIIGEIENAVVIADRVENPGMIWTKDGLYAGTLFDRRADDGLPATVYSWYLTEDNEDAITTTDNGSGGRLIQYPDGRVIWFTQGRNSVPVYEITGWDDWSRQTVPFELVGESAAAAGEGTGLSADYYKGEFAGELLANRRETRIWHGLNYSALERDGVVDGPYGAVYDWTAGNELIGQSTGFSARWRGEIEAPLTEDFVFSVYARGGARVWIDGKQIIHSWNEVTPRVESAPIPLVAGQRYRIQVDYYTNQNNPAISLNWESSSLDRQRVPQSFLYPVPSDTIDTPWRDAFNYIEAPGFDTDSGNMLEDLTGVLNLFGMRQWGFASSGAYVGYHDIDFGEGANRLILLASGRPANENHTYPVQLEFRLNGPDGPTLAEVTLKPDLQELVVDIPRLTGMQNIYVVNTTTSEWHFIDFWWFRFE